MSVLVQSQSFLLQETPLIDRTLHIKTAVLSNTVLWAAGLGLGVTLQLSLLALVICLFGMSAICTLVLHERILARRMKKQKAEHQVVTDKLRNGIDSCLDDILPKIFETAPHERWTFLVQVTIDHQGGKNGTVLCKTSGHDISTFCTQIFQSVYQNIIKDHPLYVAGVTYIAEIPLNRMSNHKRMQFFQKFAAK